VQPELKRQLTWIVLIALIASVVAFAAHRRHELDVLREIIATGRPEQRLAAVATLVAKEKLAEALQDQPRWVQDQVVAAIVRLGTPEALFQLTGALYLLDDPVAARAREALTRFERMAIGPLVKAMKDKDPNIRAGALDPLAAIGPVVIPSLLELVDAWDQYVRDGVVTVFGKLGTAVTPELIKIIQRTEPLPEQTPQRFLWARDTAVRSLLAMKVPAIQPIIDHLLTFPDPEVRGLAAQTLGQIADQTVASPIPPEEARRVVGPLLARLNTDPEWTVRRRAALALGGLGDVGKQAGVVQALIARLNDPRDEVTAGAAEALGRLGDPAAAGPLVATLINNRSGAVREIEVALEKLRAPALPALMPALQHPDVEVRRTAVAAVAAIGTPAAVVPLANALRDPDVSIRRLASDALITLADARVVPQLVAALGDPDWHVYYAARDALANLGVAALPGLVGALGGTPRVAHMAEQALTKIGAPAVGPLVGALSSPQASVRQWAAVALGDIGPPATAKTAAVLGDPSKPVYMRVAAADALGRTGDPGALAPLARAVQADLPEVQKAALRALVRLGDEKATETLVAALGAKDHSVRSVAMVLLMDWRLGEVEKLLEACLRSGDVNVQRRAAIALAFQTAAAAHELLVGWEPEQGAQERASSLEPLLMAAINDPHEDPDVRLWAVRALSYVGSERGVDVLAGLLRPQEPLAGEAARAAAYIGKRLSERQARAEQAEVARREPSLAARKLIELLLTTTDDKLRMDAAVALSLMGEDPVWGLVDAFGRAPQELKYWIAAVLGAIGKPASDACLETRGQMKSKQPELAQWATVVLELVRDAQAMDLLRHLDPSELPPQEMVQGAQRLLEQLFKARAQAVQIASGQAS
jgi:HEAT repeat protein